MKKILMPIALCMLFSAFCLGEDNSPNSHRRIIFHITDSLLSTVAADNEVLSAASIALKLKDQSQNNFLQQQIIQSLFENNTSVLLNHSAADTVLECNIREVSLDYGEVFTESIFGSRKIERSITVSLDITISSVSTGKIFYSKNLTRSVSDTVLYALINQLIDNSLPFTNVVEPQLSFFDSILEPAIVTIASGIAVYLFFTIRS